MVGWQFALVVTRWSRSTRLATPGPVNTGMGDSVRGSTPAAGKSISVYYQPGQLSLAIPPWVGTITAKGR